MYKEIREKAEKKVEAKKGFFICSIVFSFTAIVLIILSFLIPAARFWLLLPIPILGMVLGVLYISAFGWRSDGKLSEDWEEDEIEREMIKLYKKKRTELPPVEELSEKEVLELKKLERLKQKWEWGEDYV